MRKLFRRVMICALVAAMVGLGGLLADRQRLNEGLIRLHVVADSDTAEDQALKLRVRDRIIAELESVMEELTDVEQAKQYLRTNLSKLRKVAEGVLREAGCMDAVEVSLEEEAFDTRHYDSFSLPAGVYEALRITIGSGEGENWWCVVFPTLCAATAPEELEDTAAGAGFPDSLTDTLEGKEGYEVRFFLLELLGKLENLLHFA